MDAPNARRAVHAILTRTLIGALALSALLAICQLATSLLAISTAASELHKVLHQVAPAVAPAPSVVLVAAQTQPASPVVDDRPEAEAADEEPAVTGAQALQAAVHNDPDLAALVHDPDPAVRDAVLAFFADDRPTNTAK